MKYKTLLTTIALITAGLLVRPVLAAESGDLLKPYEAVSTALANDDLAAAKTAATGLAKQAKSAGNETIAHMPPSWPGAVHLKSRANTSKR